RSGGVHGLAHITGGGLTENLPRVLPETLGAQVDLDTWDLPAVFRWMAETGGMAEAELLKTFNCGIGMILVVRADRADAVTTLLADLGEDVTRLGQVSETPGMAYTGQLL
ncbi:MAG: AIR synthase-related protein, partial [Roseobacter sp.]